MMEFSLPDELAMVLKIYLTRAQALASSDHPFLFTRANQEPFYQANHFTYHFRGLMETIGCPANLRPHRWVHAVTSPKLKSF